MTANSGRAALRILLKEDDFTLILMDVQMPDLNGFETATFIYDRDKLKHIPINFITANDHGEDSIFKRYQMGGVDYMQKIVEQHKGYISANSVINGSTTFTISIPLNEVKQIMSSTYL